MQKYYQLSFYSKVLNVKRMLTLDVTTNHVEAVECFLLPIPAPYKVPSLPSLLPLLASFFKVLPLLFPQKFNRFRFHIPVPCFMKNASASGSSKSQMLPSLLPLLASFFKMLPLPQ